MNRLNEENPLPLILNTSEEKLNSTLRKANYYTVLGLHKNVTKEEINRACEQRLLKYKDNDLFREKLYEAHKALVERKREYDENDFYKNHANIASSVSDIKKRKIKKTFLLSQGFDVQEVNDYLKLIIKNFSHLLEVRVWAESLLLEGQQLLYEFSNSYPINTSETIQTWRNEIHRYIEKLNTKDGKPDISGNIRLTPLDIHNKGFNKTLNGYDANDANEFLDEIIKIHEALINGVRELETLLFAEGKVFLNGVRSPLPSIKEQMLYLLNNVIGVGVDDNVEPIVSMKDEKPFIHTKRDTNVSETTNSLDPILKEMDQFVGMENVKQTIRKIMNYIQYTKEREKIGAKMNEPLLVHSLFLGNPGTGKTSIARILGKVFKSIGILEKGHVVEVDRASLVGQYIGETAIKTENAVKEALGGILFIDEAYTLIKSDSPRDFGQEAVDTILKRMEDLKGEMVVIAAGYPKEMESFLNSNPGLKDRFKFHFQFQDYTPDELLQITIDMLETEKYTLNSNAIQLLKKEYATKYRKRDEAFGNARMVGNYVQNIKMNHATRVSDLPRSERTKDVLTTILVQDVEPLLASNSVLKSVSIEMDKEKLAEIMVKLDEMTGLKVVKDSVKEISKLIQYYKEEGEDITGKLSLHSIFLGNPGTGKTTIARLLSELYAAYGLLEKGNIVEVSRQDLVAGYTGQTAIKTNEVIDQALGGVLFIDEAYTLADDSFGQEAINTLLKRMEDDRGKFYVFVAGYSEEMKQFIMSNPGLKSRFNRTYDFEDYSPTELMEITKKMVESHGYRLDCHLDKALIHYFNDIYKNRNKFFGNGRDVRNLVDLAMKNAMLRLVDIPLSLREKVILEEDLHPLIRSIGSIGDGSPASPN